MTLVTGLIVLSALLSLPPPSQMHTYRDALRGAGGILTARFPFADISTAILASKAMQAGRDPYVPLTGLFAEEGIAWELPASTHPPTVFLMVAPIARLPLTTAMAVWAWLMLGLLALSYYWLGCPPLAAIGLACWSLLWPPVTHSLGQLTIVWLLGIVVALRYDGAARGIAIALASMTKLVPAAMILPLLWTRRWRDVAGFTAAWVLALIAVASISGSVLWRYVEINSTNAALIAERGDNASTLVTAARVAGWPGVVAVFVVIGLLVLVAARRSTTEQLLIASYVSVLVLPIAWIYSACPLIPVWWSFMQGGHSWRQWGVIASVLILLLGPFTGTASTIPIAVATLLPALGFLFDAVPVQAMNEWALRHGRGLQ